MRAVAITSFGQADTLELGEFPTPKPQSGEVRIRVKACAVNRLDLWLRKGSRNISLPHIPGSDVVGVVDEAPGSKRWKPGQGVVVNPAIPCGTCARCMKQEPCELVTILGAGTPGGYAEYVVVPAAQVHPKPTQLSFVEAAAFPLTFLTAWHMLASRAQLKPGEMVFIWGASGGLGTAGVLVAKALGARVLAAVRSDNLANRVKTLGADETFLYTDEGVAQRVKDAAGGGVDVVFESVGSATWEQSLEMLRPNGRLVIAGATSGDDVQLDLSDLYVRQLSILGARMGTREEFERVLALVNSGTLTPVVDRTYPLAEAAAAHRRLEEGGHFGKVVLEVN